MSIAFYRMTGEDAAAAVLGDEYAEVYLRIREEPPYNSGPLYRRDRFRDRTSAQAQRAGFALVAANDEAGKLAGFAFGLPMAEGAWWGGETTPGPPEAVAQAKFAVIELNLLPEYRGHGYGKRLLDLLLEGRPEPYATLLANPAAAAHAKYLRWGWRMAGTCRPAPDAMVTDVLILD
ncbi:GNAT family N-acetyltransferase [Acrocarpospora sp. B8E8]|uniref:GNAT family N-acetyltransferase n=1 Tax=Acrocarpospora sp. B8E8 TaxID=3153572 RepID=UPI00325D09FD